MVVRRAPALDHLAALTDDVGVLQHARFDVPNRSCGYCVDDVARALIVAIDAATRPETEREAARLVRTYLSYLHDAQLPDGRFHNFLGYDRRWQDDVGTEDSFGRAIWGLGACVAHAPQLSWRRLAAELLTRALPRIGELQYLRAKVYAVLGLAYVLDGAATETVPPLVDMAAVRAALETAAAAIRGAFAEHRAPDWTWCEELMTYDLARIPEALLRAGVVLDAPELRELGLEALDFLIGVLVEDGVFVPVGSDGWYPRGGTKARYGQQPLEAAAAVEAGLLAQALTGEPRYGALAEAAHDWYFGFNTAQAIMAQNGGCCDGIHPSGVNPNMGAESTISYLLAAAAMAERAPARLRSAALGQK